jgi:hypothetical protein
MAINGLAAANICESDDNVSGLELVQDYYETHRITSRATPVTVTLGATFSVRAFLVGINHQISDASSQLDQFSLMFKWLPRKLNSLDGCQGAAGAAASSSGLQGLSPGGGGSSSNKQLQTFTPINTSSGGSQLTGPPSSNPAPPLTVDSPGSLYETPSIKQQPGVV